LLGAEPAQRAKLALLFRAARQRPVSYFVEEDIGQDDVAVLTPPDENRPVYTSHKGIDLNSISGPYGRFTLAGRRATMRRLRGAGSCAVGQGIRRI
jgi:hypothetical protein